MKFLIATACLCIIATTGYYFWKEYREATADERAAQAVYEQALKEVEAAREQSSKVAAPPLKN